MAERDAKKVAEKRCPHCFQPMIKSFDQRWRCLNKQERCPAWRGNLSFREPRDQLRGEQ